MTTISANLQAVRARIAAACVSASRDPEDVTLLAISKSWPAESVAVAAAAGQRAFGENYAQEGVAKSEALRALNLEWHFVGPVQSNKTRQLAEQFSWVHSIDRLKVAERLSDQRPAPLPPLQLCLQVNLGQEAGKSGCAQKEARSLAHRVAALPRLRLRGLMALPEASADADLLHARFAALRELRDTLNAEGLSMDTLSMGMSQDFEIAIAEGATIVRVGTAIFGERK